MSYVQRPGYGRGKMDAIGEWDSRWSIDGGLGDWKDDVTTQWGRIKKYLYDALNAGWKPSSPEYLSHLAAISRLESIHAKVLAGQITPQSFAATCNDMLIALKGGQEGYTLTAQLSAVAADTARDAVSFVKDALKETAKAAGEAIGVGAGSVVKGAGEGTGTSTYVMLGYVALGVGAWYAVRRVLS